MVTKRSIQCKDKTYVTGDAAQLVSLARRYPMDFTDENVNEIISFAEGVKDSTSAKIAQWLLESRHEEAAGSHDLGQVKIDMFENVPTELITSPGYYECEIWREGEKVLLYVSGTDEEGYWRAANRYDIDEFLALDEGSLEKVIGETIFYNKIYESCA